MSFLMASISGAVAEQSEFELKARQDGAQIVRDAGEHGGALLDGAFDAALHLQERGRGAAHLARAARAEILRLAALAEGFRRVGEPHDRPDLVAQEGDRDRQHDQRRRHHPDQEDPRIRIVDVGARREDAHDRAGKLDADFHDRGAADGVDPERQADLLADIVGQRLVELIEERLWPGRRQLAAGDEIDHEAEPVLRDAAELRMIGILREGLIDVDQGGDFLRHRRRQIIRHQIPVPLQEQQRDHRLQHHHGHDDDQQRTGIKPLRHHRFEPAAEAVPRLRDRPHHGGAGARQRIRRRDQLAGGSAQAAEAR